MDQPDNSTSQPDTSINSFMREILMEVFPEKLGKDVRKLKDAKGIREAIEKIEGELEELRRPHIKTKKGKAA